jgi:hypothetical protein
MLANFTYLILLCQLPSIEKTINQLNVFYVIQLETIIHYITIFISLPIYS